MGVAEKQDADQPLDRSLDQIETQETDAGTCIEDDDLPVCCLYLYTGSVAADTDGVWTGHRNGASNAPESHPHGATFAC